MEIFESVINRENNFSYLFRNFLIQKFDLKLRKRFHLNAGNCQINCEQVKNQNNEKQKLGRWKIMKKKLKNIGDYPLEISFLNLVGSTSSFFYRDTDSLQIEEKVANN